MKLLVLIESEDHVSYRYRVRAFQPALQESGWDVVVRQLPRSAAGFAGTLRVASRSDVVLLQRRLLSTWRLRLLRHCARRLIYDFDDAVFLRDSNSRKSPQSWQRRRRFQAIVSACDVVIAGNEHLAESTRLVAPAVPVHVIPTCVDPGAYRPAIQPGPRQGLRLAWIGSGSTLPSLESIHPALSVISRSLPGFELHVICDRAPDLPGVTTCLRPWSSQSEADDLARCDAGISWLPDHPWSLGKCGLKVLQYMAAGLPVVANALAVHNGLVTSGANGILLDGPQRLGDVLWQLAETSEIRMRMGEEGRRRVTADYSTRRWMWEFVELLHRASRKAGSHRAA
jgi:glycosyltransferase involved in cell wall biosynthesis